MNLTLLILVPLLTLIGVMLSKAQQSKVIAAIGSGAQLLLAAWLTIQYKAERASGNTAAVLFEYQKTWFENWDINYHIGVDGISVMMILLSSMVIFAGVLVSWKIEKLSKEFFSLLVFLGTGAYGFFISLDLFTLFFFFELAVIPKYLLIGIWGSGKKEYSAMKLALMLMGGSALVLVGILALYFNSNTTEPSFNLLAIAEAGVPENVQMIFFPIMFLGFAVIGALFPFHTWAPDGHSSAPTAASMFLAGISMKLGGYGALKVAIFLMPQAAHHYSPYIIILATISVIYGAIVTLYQKDLKLMNAYSSVSHCGFVMLGLGMLTHTASVGAVLQLISHGVMTALFFAVIGMIYERTKNRMRDELGGLLKVMPFIGLGFILAGLTSLGLPGLSGFVAEMTVFVGAFEVDSNFTRIATIISTTSIVVTAVYIIRAIGAALMGPIKNEAYKNLSDATWNEKVAIGVLLVGIVGMGSLPFWIADLVGDSTDFLFNHILSVAN